MNNSQSELWADFITWPVGIVRTSDSVLMRILFLCNTFYPSAKGGAEIHAYKVATILAQRHDVTVLYQADDADEDSRSHYLFNSIVIEKPRNALDYLLRGLWMVLELGRGYDIIHVHTAFAPMILGTLLTILTRKPLYVTAHGSDIRISGFIPALWYWQHLSFRRSKMWTVVSEDMRTILVEKYGFSSTKIMLVRNAFDEEMLSWNGIPGNGVFRICFIGSLRHEKNPLALVEIAGGLENKSIDYEIRMVGDGPLRDKLEQALMTSGLGHRFQIVGQQPHAEAMRILRDSDVLLITSIHEGLPTAMLEAMALGKPVVATPVGGIPEILKHQRNGLMFGIGDYSEAVVLLSSLATDRMVRETIGRRGRESVKSFTWISVAMQYERIYSGKIGH